MAGQNASPAGYIEKQKRESHGASLTIGELISVVSALRETQRSEDAALADDLKGRMDKALSQETK